MPTSEDASWGAAFDPNLSVYQWDAFDPASPNFGKPRPWVAAANDPSEFFETPIGQNYSVLLDAGGEKRLLQTWFHKEYRDRHFAKQ